MSEEANDGSGYALVVSFPDQSASFALGHEAGGLWQRMTSGTAAEIEAVTHTANREVIRRQAVAAGWSVECRPSDVPGWDYTTLTKTVKAPERPNPHGLAVVKG